MDNRWNIYSKSGVAKYISDNLEYTGTWMGECFVTVTVKSAEPVDFEIGDYIEYRGEKFVLANDPTVIKKARRGSYGEGFTYDNIKFSALHTELTDIRFLDYVLYDNELHYTALPVFPFYAASIEDYCDRLQANTNRWCAENGFNAADYWVFVTPNKNSFIQRALTTGMTQADATAIWNEAYGEDGGNTSTDDEKTDVSVSVSNQSIWDAIALIKSSFGLNFINRGRRVIIGSAGLPTNHIFEYGKGNGLYEMERQADSEQQIITKLYAYGSEKNMPVRYYANMTRKPYITVSTKETTSTGLHNIKTDIPYHTVETALEGLYYVMFKFGSMTCQAQIDKSAYEGDGVKMLEFTLWGNGNVSEQEFYNALSVGSKVYITSDINIDKWNTQYIEFDSDGMPNNMAVSHLMLPGFPTQSLYDWVKANGGTDCDDATGQATWKGYTAIFSKEQYRPYIQSLNSAELGIKESSKTFDGSDDSDEIYPTIENTGADTIYHAEVVSDNGIFEDGEDEPTITLTLPDLGDIDLKAALNDKTQDGGTPTIAMTDGYCGAREFEILDANKENNKWIVKCKREYDDLLQIYFPYSYNVSQGQTAVDDEPYQVRGGDLPGYTGDHYVLTGIKMPSFYIQKAAEKMLEASLEFLSKNDYTRYTYLPKVDELFMARQHDEYLRGQSLRSLYLTIKEGDLLRFQDEDLRIGDSLVFIDTLTIKENGNANIPTYEVTLRSDKAVGTIQRLQNQIDSLSTSGGAGGSGGGSINTNQINSLIEGTGETLFLSKIKEDAASEVIGFAKGLWVKTKGVFGIDEEGNGKLNALSLTGLLKGMQGIFTSLTADSIESDNYTGDGIADTGYRLTKDDGTGSSALVVDNLHVRKKATFEELEVKKETAIAGNQVYSAAANIINRTDYYDAQGNLLGYSEQTRPWLLKNVPIFLLGIFFGRVVRTRIYLDPNDISNIATVRCYFLAKDDEREVDNMWEVNDLARCQTFNLKTSKRNTYIKDASKSGQVYWWRKVIAVSSESWHNDEDDKDYHYFDVSMSPNDCDPAGTDIPAAGDHVVQFGNTTEASRQNITTVEVTNNDSPAIKMYQGINSFNLNDKRIIALGYNPTTHRAFMEEFGDAFIGDKNNKTYIKYDSVQKLLEIKARISMSSTMGDGNTFEEFVNTLNSTLTEINNQVDKKAETWYQSNDPSTAWNTDTLKAAHVGDLWYKTSDDTTWYYKDKGASANPRYTWEQQNIPQSVFDTIDGKSNIYVTWGAWGNDLHVRDLFIPNADTTQGGVTYKKDKVYRCLSVSPIAFKEIEYTDDTALNDFFTNTYSPFVTNIQNQVDGKIETWFQTTDPSGNWTTESAKKAHVGDMWYNGNTHLLKRYTSNTSGGTTTYSWTTIEDQKAIDAYSNAATAQDTADGKRRVFVSQPTAADEYDEGDLWVNATYGTTYSNDVLRCKTHKDAGSAFDIAHWQKASDYTNDNALITFLNGYSGTLTDITNQIDQKSETWYQATDPSTAWTTTEMKTAHKGDIWHNTSNQTIGGVEAGLDAIWSGTAWVVSNVPQSVYDKIDGKGAIYTTWNAWGNGLQVKDLFIPQSDTPQGGVTYKANKVYRCTATNPVAFQEVNYTDDSTINDFISNTYTPFTETIKAQVDGKAETWYQSTDPSVNWNTDALKQAHIGDIWHNTNSQAVAGVGANLDAIWNGSSWVVSDVPQSVYDKIDGKADIFVSRPSTYNENDMWIISANDTNLPTGCVAGDIVVSSNTRTNNYQASDWSKKDRYTDDSKVDNMIANQYWKQLVNGTVDANVSQAVSDASSAKSQAEQAASDASTAAQNAANARNDADRAANSAAQAATDASNMTTRLNDWASDQKISPSEKLSLKNQKNDVVQEFSQICTEADKYSVAKLNFINAYDRAIAAFNKYTADSPENITVESDYANIAAYYSARTTILNAIAEAAKKVATDADDKAQDAYDYADEAYVLAEDAERHAQDAISGVGQLDAIKTALNGGTTVDGGLLLTSLIGLRQKNSDGTYTTFGGISGVFNGNPQNIAAWFGGGMIDGEASGWTGAAKSLIRMNGSGYFAGGNISWNENGSASFYGTIYATSGEFTGKVTATSGEFTGKITANDGSIGGFEIEATTIKSSNNNIVLNADGSATFKNGDFEVTSGSNSIKVNSSGFEAKWGGEGFRVSSNGMERWDSIRNVWAPMYERKIAKVFKATSINLGSTENKSVNYVLNARVNWDNRTVVYLPNSTNVPNGTSIIVRGLARDCDSDVVPAQNSGDVILVGDYKVSSVGVLAADCAEFILCKDVNTYIRAYAAEENPSVYVVDAWLCNMYDRDV